MDNSAASVTKHLTRPIPANTDVPVEIFIGSECRPMSIRRTLDFGTMTISSIPGETDPFPPNGAPGPRRFAKALLGKFWPPVPTDYHFDTRIHEPNNIAHLMIDLIPCCLLAREAVGDVTCLFRPLGPRFRELLDYFGIEPLCTYKRVSGQKLDIWLSREIAQYSVWSIRDCPLLPFTPDVYAPYFKQVSGPRKLYISRKGSRALTNEAEVRALLEERGYTTVFMEDHSIAEQIALVQGADDIVAIHGAAMGYLALKERTRLMVELLPPNVYHSLFPMAVGQRVDRYVQLIPYFEENVQLAGWPAILAHKQRAFSVDMNQLRRAIDEN